MVRVELYQAGPGELTGFRAVGHAGYAPPGEDIVCAGVSALTQACVLGLKDHLQLPVILKAEHGLLECRLPREIPAEAKAPAQAILETMVLALREIEKEHGRYFALISLDAPRGSRNRRGGRRGRRSEARQGRPDGAPAQAEPAPAQAMDPSTAEEQPQEAASQGRTSRRRRGSRRRKAEPAAANRAARAPEAPAAPPEGGAEAQAEEPAPPVPAEPEPEQQVAVAQDPAEKQKRAIINPFRRKRLRSFKPGRLGRRWRP